MGRQKGGVGVFYLPQILLPPQVPDVLTIMHSQVFPGQLYSAVGVADVKDTHRPAAIRQFLYPYLAAVFFQNALCLSAEHILVDGVHLRGEFQAEYALADVPERGCAVALHRLGLALVIAEEEDARRPHDIAVAPIRRELLQHTIFDPIEAAGKSESPRQTAGKYL